MSTNKMRTALLAGASALAISVAMSAPAKAFDVVNWEFYATVNKTVTEEIVISTNVAPTGLVMLENLQVHIGDVTAESTVTGVYNNTPTEGGDGGPVEVDLGNLFFTGNYDSTSGAVSGTATAAELDGESLLTGSVNPDDPFGVTMNFDLGTITVEAPEGEAAGPFDALTELPEVVSAATAVANNSNVYSETAVNMHEGQFAFGDINGGGDSSIPTTVGIDTGNTHTDIALGLTLLGALGVIEKGEVSATSTVSDIWNATVDSSATAVVNNKNITVETDNLDNQVLIADVTQWGFMDVMATSSVSNVSINNYTNLGALDRPIVSSVATAVGNNLNISVGAPSGE